jgi:hypothetical protein
MKHILSPFLFSIFLVFSVAFAFPSDKKAKDQLKDIYPNGS